MKNNKKGFISITIIYSFFILFVSILLLILYNYINDRKMNNKIKSDLLNTLRDKSPDITLSDYGSTSPHPSYNVNILILDGGNGIASAKYTWSANPLDEAVTDLSSYNETISAPTDPGFYYLIVKACDVNDHCKTVITNFFQVGDTYICKKAETLHNENCSNTDEDGHCLGFGLEQNAVINYGNFSSNYFDDVGTAYDCDVNGDGTYDPVTERFYYLNDFYNTDTKEFDDKKAVLVYYANVHNGVANNTYTCAYTTGSSQTPTTAYNELPTTTQWSNVSLIASERDIISTNGFDQFSRVYSYTGSSQTFTANYTGTYKVELWGAQGGDGQLAKGGLGAYTSGLIELTNNETLYVYVGGENSGRTGGYNGGGNGSNDTQFFGGGGATDVRLVSGTWNDPESLASRIMVAGGGGGSYNYQEMYHYYTDGGAGGTFIGASGGVMHGGPASKGGTQLEGGKGNNGNSTYSGSFGQGGNGANNLGTGGGGGYYGGGGTYNVGGSAEGGAGGSSYISGQVGSIAIAAADDLSPRLDSNNEVCTYPSTIVECSYHYSGKKFTETEMVDGNGYESVFSLNPDTDAFEINLGEKTDMPTHDGTDLMTGNEGNGFAKITYLGVYNPTTESYDLPADLPTNMFTYTNKAARLLSYQELKRCVDLSTYSFNTTAQIGLKNSCTFLYENTKFANPNNVEGYFLESYYPDDNTIWVYDSSKNAIYSGVSKSTSNKYGVRPVIEIPKTRIQYN